MRVRVHPFEKVVHHWQRKRGATRPDSTARAGAGTRRSPRPPYGRAELFGRTKAELMTLARRFDIPRRSRMSKAELERALMGER